jgi:hypothetical protein
LDCCKNKLNNCKEIICSEIVAYYHVDCRGLLGGRLDCADKIMRESVERGPCKNTEFFFHKEDAQKCIDDYKESENQF